MIKRALLIGINYDNVPSLKLNGCVNDVFAISNMLIDVYGYDKSNVVIMYDDAAPNLQPTTANILRELLNIVQLPSDELWIHYSGHGTNAYDQNGDELDRRDEAIVPNDIYGAGSIITDDKLLTIFSQCKCPTYLMFDCCHSGSICDLQWRFEYMPRTGRFMRFNENKRSIANPNIVMLSGCRDTQTSADAYNIETHMAMGAMTNALIDTIRDNKYNASFLKIYADMCGWLARKGHSQFPCLSSSTAVPIGFKLTTAIATAPAPINKTLQAPSLRSVMKQAIESTKRNSIN